MQIEKITERIRDGRITARDWIFLPDPGEWYPVVEIPQLASAFYLISDKPSAAPQIEAGKPAASASTMAHIGDEKFEFGGQMVEKRRWIRLPTALALQFGLDAATQDALKAFETTTLDISEGGLGFNWSMAIPVGTFMRLELDIFPHLLKTKGRVARCQTMPDGSFLIGVLFVSLSEKDHAHLKEFLASVIASSAG